MATPAAWAFLLVGSAWWCTFVPYAPSHMLRPIPHDAVFLSVHRDVLDRWDGVVSNDLVRRAVESAGPELDYREGALAVQGYLRRLGVGDVAAAYLPASAFRDEPTWIAVGWLGGRSQISRWSLQLGGDPSLEKLNLPYGRNAWIIQMPAFGDSSLGIAFVEGMVIAVLSRDRGAIAGMVDCFDGLRPRILHALTSETEQWVMSGPGGDRGWIRSVPSAGWLFEIEAFESARIHVHLRRKGALNLPAASGSAAAASELSAWFDGIPRAFCFAHPILLKAMNEGAGGSPILSLIQPIGQAAGNDSIYFVGTGGEYGGRVSGLRVPALFACVPLWDGIEPESVAGSVLQRISERTGLDLWFRPDEILGMPVSIIESEDSSSYGRLAESEKSACFRLGRWLIFCSSREALQRLAERQAWAGGEKSEPATRGILSAEAMGSEECVAAGWAELVPAMKSLRNLLAVSELSQQGDPDGRDRAMRLYRIARGVSEALEAYRILRVRAVPGPAFVEFEVELEQ
jgi:hypothetical protein